MSAALLFGLASPDACCGIAGVVRTARYWHGPRDSCGAAIFRLPVLCLSCACIHFYPPHLSSSIEVLSSFFSWSPHQSISAADPPPFNSAPPPSDTSLPSSERSSDAGENTRRERLLHYEAQTRVPVVRMLMTREGRGAAALTPRHLWRRRLSGQYVCCFAGWSS